MKRALATGALALFALLSAVPVASAQDEITIREIDASKFPQVTVAVSGVTEPDSIRLYENGSAAGDLMVASFGQAGQAVDVVLTIDTSGSMSGDAMTSAIAAATSFVRGLPDHVRVGIVTFSSTPRVALRLTDDLNAALNVIANLVPSGETALYDAVALSSNLFKGSNQRNIILLSDGGDTTSSRGLKAAAKAAASKGATVFSVGIEGSEQDVGALRRISSATEGTYAPAATAELGGVYETLATDLSEQVLVSYESTSTAGNQVPIRVVAGAGVDTAVVLIPARRVPDPGGDSPPAAPSGSPFPSGAMGLAVVLTSAFLAIFLLFFLVFGSRVSKRRDEFLSHRLGLRSSTLEEEENERDDGPGAWIPDSLVEMADQIAKTGGLSKNLEIKLQRSGWKLKVGEFVASVFLAALAGGVLGSLLIQTPFFAILATLVGGATPLILLSIRMHRRLSKLHAQLPDILMIIASSLRAGHSFMQALGAVAAEAGEPGGAEFDRLMTEVRLGRPINTAMNDLAERIGSMDFKWAVLAVDIQRDVGGNLSEVLDNVAGTMRERERVRRQVDVLSTEGRMSIYILAGLPIGVALYMAVANPEYIGLLVTTQIGLAMLTVAAVLLVIGIVWMRRVVKIDV